MSTATTRSLAAEPADTDDRQIPGIRRLGYLDSIAFRLIAVVVVTGLFSFAIIGAMSARHMNTQLQYQAETLERFAEQQLAARLDTQARLAIARIDNLQKEATSQLRSIVRRPDLIKAIQSNNDVGIRDLIGKLAGDGEFERIVALDSDGRVIGASQPLDLLRLNTELVGLIRQARAGGILSDNLRIKPKRLEIAEVLTSGAMQAMKVPDRPTLSFTYVEPVFDDFGDQVGSLAAFRFLHDHEATLDQFSALAKSGVAVMSGADTLATGGDLQISIPGYRPTKPGLLFSSDGTNVLRCTAYQEKFEVCTYTDRSVIDEARDQMFHLGEQHMRDMIGYFISLAGVTMLVLIAALLISVSRLTNGLYDLRQAAREIARGNLNVRFLPSGVGEIYYLGRAFERMLGSIRTSTQKIQKLAFYDSLSDLPNRAKMQEDWPRLQEAFPNAAVFFMDLDGFKAINDTLGHKTGDALLRQVGERLNQLLDRELGTQNFMLARFGGDEFAIYLAGVDTRDQAAALSGMIIAALREPYLCNGQTVFIGASIGISFAPEDGTEYHDLMMKADLAMYAAKNAGKNTHFFYIPSLSDQAHARRVLENDLLLAIRNEQLTVVFQPKVLCANGKIRGCEALVRWTHPEHGPVSPAKFIKIAEETGMVRDIDRFVLKRAMIDVGAMIKAGADLVLSVNATAAEIEDPLYARDVIKLIHELDYPATRLELEITESVATINPEMLSERMTILRQAGVRFSMDDFGAGYSNLATLARLPFDALKLDRSLVHGVAKDKERQSIFRVAILLATELGLETVAEGVEQHEDLDFIAECGVTMIQGYIFSRPVPLDEFAAMVDPRRLLPEDAQTEKARRRAALRVISG